MRTYQIFLFLASTSLTPAVAIADYAELMEECGGHTDYGLAKQESPQGASSQSASTKPSKKKKREDVSGITVAAPITTFTSGDGRSRASH